MLRRVAVIRTGVSEEFNASFIMVTIIGELGTTLAVISNCIHHSHRREKPQTLNTMQVCSYVNCGRGEHRIARIGRKFRNVTLQQSTKHRDRWGWNSNLPKPTECNHLSAYSRRRRQSHPMYQRCKLWCLPRWKYYWLSNEIRSWHRVCSSRHITARYSPLSLSISRTVCNCSTKFIARYRKSESTVRRL
jgi:hypothetical protein